MQINRIKQIICLLTIVLVGFQLQSCTNERSYESMAEESVESGVRADSLFLGYHFGMTTQEFLSSSWKMNQEGLITGGAKVEYKMTELRSTATMEFYPEFRNDVIVRMPVRIRYDSWAPWNEDLQPEQLLAEMIELYESEYDTEFEEMYVPDIEQMAYISFEGNREIRMYKNSSNSILVDFRDLTVYSPQAS